MKFTSFFHAQSKANLIYKNFKLCLNSGIQLPLLFPKHQLHYLTSKLSAVSLILFPNTAE